MSCQSVSFAFVEREKNSPEPTLETRGGGTGGRKPGRKTSEIDLPNSPKENAFCELEPRIIIDHTKPSYSCGAVVEKLWPSR